MSSEEQAQQLYGLICEAEPGFNDFFRELYNYDRERPLVYGLRSIESVTVAGKVCGGAMQSKEITPKPGPGITAEKFVAQCMSIAKEDGRLLGGKDVMLLNPATVPIGIELDPLVHGIVIDSSVPKYGVRYHHIVYFTEYPKKA